MKLLNGAGAGTGKAIADKEGLIEQRREIGEGGPDVPIAAEVEWQRRGISRVRAVGEDTDEEHRGATADDTGDARGRVDVRVAARMRPAVGTVERSSAGAARDAACNARKGEDQV